MGQGHIRQRLAGPGALGAPGSRPSSACAARKQTCAAHVLPPPVPARLPPVSVLLAMWPTPGVGADHHGERGGTHPHVSVIWGKQHTCYTTNPNCWRPECVRVRAWAPGTPPGGLKGGGWKVGLAGHQGAYSGSPRLASGKSKAVEGHPLPPAAPSMPSGAGKAAGGAQSLRERPQRVPDRTGLWSGLCDALAGVQA